MCHIYPRRQSSLDTQTKRYLHESLTIAFGLPMSMQVSKIPPENVPRYLRIDIKQERRGILLVTAIKPASDPTSSFIIAKHCFTVPSPLDHSFQNGRYTRTNILASSLPPSRRWDYREMGKFTQPRSCQGCDGYATVGSPELYDEPPNQSKLPNQTHLYPKTKLNICHKLRNLNTEHDSNSIQYQNSHPQA